MAIRFRDGHTTDGPGGHTGFRAAPERLRALPPLAIVDPAALAAIKAVAVEAARTWGSGLAAAEREVHDAANRISRLLDRGQDAVTCDLIYGYNQVAVELYQKMGATWNAFRTLLESSDLPLPKPPAFFGSAVHVIGPFAVAVDVPCKDGRFNAELKRFDLPAQVANRSGEVFDGAFRAKDSTELKAVHMAQALGVAPAVVLFMDVLIGALAAIAVFLAIRRLIGWLSGTDAAEQKNAYHKLQQACILRRIKIYEECVSGGGAPGSCQQNANALVECPDPTYVAPEGVIDKLGNLLIIGGLVVGGVLLIKNRK